MSWQINRRSSLSKNAVFASPSGAAHAARLSGASRFAPGWLAICLLLAGCGFQPLYGKQDNGKPDALAGVKIDPIGGGRMGQQFKADLEDQLNPQGAVPPNAKYRLNASLTKSESAIGIAPDGTILRYNVYLDSNYTLYRVSDNKPVTTGSLRNVSSYNNVTNAYFSTYISKEDAIKRSISELSEMYRQRLAAYLSAPDEMAHAN